MATETVTEIDFNVPLAIDGASDDDGAAAAAAAGSGSGGVKRPRSGEADTTTGSRASPGDRPLRVKQRVYTVPMSMHRENRQRLVARLTDAPAGSLLLFLGGKAATRHDTDHEELFRQESSFQFLFGVRDPDCFATIDASTGRTTLYVPRLPQEYAVWMGEIKPTEHFRSNYEVDDCKYVDELKSSIGELNPPRLYTLRGLNSDSGNYAEPATFDGIDAYDVDGDRLYREVVECRVIKTPEELRTLQYLNDVSSDAHLQVMRHAQVGMREYQLESLFQHWGYFRGGCRHCSYTSICGTGTNSAILHYGHAGAPNEREMRDGDLALLDMGGEFHCYASDITCTFPINGKFTADQKMIFVAVQQANFAVMDAMRPGVNWIDMHTLSYRVILTHLKAGGLLRGDVDEMMQANLCATFMPHGLGHFMGLDTHDVGGYPEGTTRSTLAGYKSLRCVRDLQPGMVITVEPGCYFIDHLLDAALADPNLARFIVPEALARFRGFGGVRLEDDVYLTEDGIVNMTNAPRTVEDVEAVCAGRITDRKQLYKRF